MPAPNPPGQPSQALDWQIHLHQGITALHLNIAGGAGNAITATFNFGPLAENPEAPEGAPIAWRALTILPRAA
jgi:hypothetical protein